MHFGRVAWLGNHNALSKILYYYVGTTLTQDGADAAKLVPSCHQLGSKARMLTGDLGYGPKLMICRLSLKPGWLPSWVLLQIQKIIEESRFHSINALRGLFVQIDVVLTFHSWSGNSKGMSLWKPPHSAQRLRAKRANLWQGFPGLYEDIYREFPDRNGG